MMARAVMIAATISPSSSDKHHAVHHAAAQPDRIVGIARRFKGGPQFGAGNNVVAVQDAGVLGFPSHL